jgi:hypothetical protein
MSEDDAREFLAKNATGLHPKRFDVTFHQPVGEDAKNLYTNAVNHKGPAIGNFAYQIEGKGRNHVLTVGRSIDGKSPSGLTQGSSPILMR